MRFFSFLVLELTSSSLSTLEKKNSDLSQIEVNEVSGLMSHIAAKVPSNNTMPGWIVFLVELLLDECSNILLNIVFFQSLSSTVHSILLHFFGHVRILNYCLPLSHLDEVSCHSRSRKNYTCGPECSCVESNGECFSGTSCPRLSKK